LRRAVGPFIYKQDNFPMEWLRPQALRHEHNRFVPESEAPQRHYSLDFVSRHGNLRKALPVVPATQPRRRQTVSNRDLSRAHVAREPCETEAAADIPSEIDDEAISAAILEVFDCSVQSAGKPHPERTRKVSDPEDANVGWDHRVSQTLRFNDRRPLLRAF